MLWGDLRVRSGRFLFGDRLFKHSHHITLLHDEIFDPIELHLGAGPFSEQHPVTDLQVDRDELAGLVAASRTPWTDEALNGELCARVWSHPTIQQRFRIDGGSLDPTNPFVP